MLTVVWQFMQTVRQSKKSVVQLVYATAISSLMYATHYTKPDIACCKVSRSQVTLPQNFKNYKIFACLNRTIEFGLFYNSFPMVLKEDTSAS